MEESSSLVTSVAGSVTEVTHPLVQHKLGLLRDATTTTQMFRQLANELTLLLTYEATKDLADEEVEVETPLEWTKARRISGKKVAVCPILRAGVGMLDAVLSLIPVARVGFIGLFRDEETLELVTPGTGLSRGLRHRRIDRRRDRHARAVADVTSHDLIKAHAGVDLGLGHGSAT